MKKMLKLMLTASVSAAVMLASCTEGDLPASPTPVSYTHLTLPTTSRV